MNDLIRQIQANVNDYPDMTIIVDQGENNFFTYRSFDNYARRIASKLSRMGVSRRDFVTIELPRNKEYIAAMYAIWMVGAAFAPLSPTYPEERLAFIRDNCGAKAVINAKFLRNIENEDPL
ncbi:MAG: AMP-binding protein, partial [Ruminococcus sp.]|nr:AMP-binding protein [Ruminococcus sp.]